MSRSVWVRRIGGTCFIVGLLAGIDSAVAQTSDGQQNRSSGGTQGLQERLYEERMKELQQNQGGPQQSHGKDDQAGKRQGSGSTGTQSQSGAGEREGTSGHNSGRTDR
ncbi:MAG: hypothetical protein ABS70_04435 [Nitrospira sp. SCN 59-13]|nr:MAG: hypothetical protein ABS70_04435 [Nitrospira sp. SCN 59-13]